MHYTPFTPRPSVGNPDRISPRTWARISVDSEDQPFHHFREARGQGCGQCVGKRFLM